MTSAPSALPARPAAFAPPEFVWPKLKPIIPKPFPEGADEATVCAAIDSQEPDLWLRFGHLVPVSEDGAVYILETGPENKDKLEKYIGRDYVYGYHTQQASCRGNLTLLYIWRMFEKSEHKGKPFGREHLSETLEKKFGIKTRASFQFHLDHKRFADYCRADAELCDQLLKMDLRNDGFGVCVLAVSKCELQGRGKEAELLTKCHTIPRSTLACLYYARPGNERRSCSEQVLAALCP